MVYPEIPHGNGVVTKTSEMHLEVLLSLHLEVLLSLENDLQ